MKSLDKKVRDLQQVISDENAANSGPFAQMMQIVEVGMDLGSCVAGVATGVGAVAAVGRGFATLQGLANSATDVFDLVGDVKRELKDGSLAKFKTGLNDLRNGAKSIYDIGSLIGELDDISSAHPDPRMREIAETQRESILLNQEVALHTQMEKEARLGVDAAEADMTAINQNVALSVQLAGEIRSGAATDIDEVVRPLLVSLRQLLDMLSIRLFVTQPAREIYLGHDPDTVVRHDYGHVHPDRERMLGPSGALNEIHARLDADAPRIIEWSSLVQDMLETDAAGLSRTPISLWFSTQDPQLLNPLRTSGALGFYVPVEALFEEDGSQLYEVKFDGIRVILHGAKTVGGASGQSIKLRQLGRWSVRRRPDARNPNGVVKDFALKEREAHLACRVVPGGVEAELAPPFNPRAQPPTNMWGRGIAGDWELSDVKGLDFTGVTKVEIEFRNQALSHTSFAGRGAPGDRLLRPLPGWPVPKPAPRSGIPVPPRLLRSYGYRYGVGSVAAVGAALV